MSRAKIDQGSKFAALTGKCAVIGVIKQPVRFSADVRGEQDCLGGLPHLSCKHDQIKMRDYMERRVTPPRRVTSPTWGPPPPCKQALTVKVI